MRFLFAAGTAVCIAAGALLPAGGASAQFYPARTVRFVVPYPPGGAADVLGRVIAQKLSDRFGQPVVTENRPGASGLIGSEVVARSPPDGYTLLMASMTHVTNPSLQAKLPYNTLHDFDPVTMVALIPNVLVTHRSLPVSSVRELIAFARRHPGELTYASAGNGSATHLAGVLFSAMAGIVMTHVPYKGGGPALAALLGGEIPLMFGSMLPTVPHVRSGRLRALAVTSSRRSPALPGVPTVAEAGLPGYEAIGWFAVLVPAKTPGLIVNKLNSEIVAALNTPELKTRLSGVGVEIWPSTPGELDDYIRRELVKWGREIRQAGIRPD